MKIIATKTDQKEISANVVAILRAAAAVGALMATVGVAQAQTTLEEVIVTAQRRDQNLQEVGVSVTALSAERIRDLGITNSTDIGRVAPGVVFTATTAGTASAMSMRGISQSDFSAVQEAPNSIYYDDVYLSASGAASFSTFDLERIEVLRGPQGTLFGRNATGGLARFVTAKPTSTFEGYGEVGVGAFNGYWVEGAVSGPFSDRVRGRLAVKQEQADGWWENRAPGGKDTMETNALGVRGQLEFDVTEKLLARLSIGYSKQPRHLAGTYKSRNFYFDGTGVPTPQQENLDAWGTGPGNNLYGYRDPYADGQTSAFENRGFLESDSSSPTLMLQWTLGSTTLTSITNYTEFSSEYAEEIDGSPIDFAAATARQSLRQWSQEIRGAGSIGSHEWTAGVYYLDIEMSTFGDFFFPMLAGSDFAYDNYQTMNQQTNSLATFGQVEWQLGERLTLITGIRYTYDEKTFDSQVYFRELGNGYSGGAGTSVFPPPGLLVYDFQKATAGNLAEQNEGLWSGKIQLDYKPESGGLLYAGVSRGVKGAGFNGNLGGGLSNEDTPFGSESVMTFELGSKFDLLDKTLRLNSSVYYYNYSDYQGYAFNGLQGLVGNYDGRFFGAELEIQANLPGDVLASIAASYSDTQLSDVRTAYFGVKDVEAVLAPQWIVNGFMRKDFQIGSGRLAALWSFDYVSERYASVDNNPATFIDDSVVQNLRFTYTLDDSGLEFAAFVNNVTDTDRQTFVYDVVGTGGITGNLYDRPRTWGLSVRKSF